jgi:hypothetical protein
MKLKNTHIITLPIALALMLCNPAQSDVQKFGIHDNGEKVFVSDDTWQPEGFENGTTVPAPFIDENIIAIDGFDNEPAWIRAPEVTVPLVYGSVNSVSVKALYSSTDVFIRVRWRDDSEDRQHHPWVWDETSEQYVTSPQIEDSLILSFEAGCEWFPSFLAGYVYDFDGWQWLAAQSDPVFKAIDIAGTIQNRSMPTLNFVPYQSRNTEDIWLLKFIDKDKEKFNASWEQLDRVYMRQHAIESLYYRGEPDNTRRQPKLVNQLPAPKNPPANGKKSYPQYLPVKYEGEAGEVAAKGHWQDGYWTVEFQRVHVTPAMTKNDTMFKRLTQFSIHVFDHVERIDQSSESDRLFLRFLPPEPLLVKE